MNLLQSEKYKLSTLCELLGYTRQAYYRNMQHYEIDQFYLERILQKVLAIRLEQPKIGGRKLYHLLTDFIRDENISMGRDALFDLLRNHHLLIRRRKRKPITTFSRHSLRKYPNLILNLIPIKPCQLWVSDITYIKLKSDFAYLSLVTDAYSRMVVGFYLSESLSAIGCIKALTMAIKCTPSYDNLIHHSDRGIQYCSNAYIKILKKAKIKISMTQSGDPRENAIAERVNGILKTEFLEDSYANIDIALFSIEQGIKTYNMKRPHSSIDMLTPSSAHISSGGVLKQRWKSYYKKVKRKEVSMR